MCCDLARRIRSFAPTPEDGLHISSEALIRDSSVAFPRYQFAGLVFLTLAEQSMFTEIFVVTISLSAVGAENTLLHFEETLWFDFSVGPSAFCGTVQQLAHLQFCASTGAGSLRVPCRRLPVWTSTIICSFVSLVSCERVLKSHGIFCHRSRAMESHGK